MSSFWIETTKKLEKEYPLLSEDIDADVCIIGGGLVGITSAYYLSKTNLKVTLLERDKICSKVSGNSTAKITSQHGLFYSYLINSYGVEYAKEYLDANQEAIDRIREIIENEKIDCDFSNQDSYVYAYSKEGLSEINREIEAMKSMGFPCEFVKHMPLKIDSLGAIRFSNQAQFNPRKYGLKLCDISSKNGIDIFENTVVKKIEKNDDDTYTVKTMDSIVNAKHVILATHYPIVNFPGFYFLKMYQSMSHVIAVDTKENLPDGIYINAEEPTYSFRTVPYGAEKLLIVAGSDYKTGAKILLDDAYKILEEKARELYPNCEVLYKWCTEDCISLDKIPYIGDFSKIMPNLYVATGFKKWGIAFSNVAAKIITDKILGEKNNYEDTFKATRLKPIKNHEELGNMIKESMYSLVINKLKEAPDTLKNIKNEEGKIVEIDDEKVGVYRDEKGALHFVKPVCAHLGCELSFNNLEKTWDCPCHGSRYDIDGKIISEPAINDLDIPSF